MGTESAGRDVCRFPKCAMWPAISRTTELGLQVDIDRDTAGRFGITPQNIDDTLYDAFGQRQVSTIFTQANQYHVILEADRAVAAESGALSTGFDVQVGSASANLASTVALAGTNTALTGAARWHRFRSALLRTVHRSRPRSPSTIRASFPVVTLSFNLAPGASLGDGGHAYSPGDAGYWDAGQHRADLPGHGARLSSIRWRTNPS